MKNKIICIVGPTASGKTGLGVLLAEKFDGEIISADSRQVYKGLDIGTGKELAEYGDVKYHLIDTCNPEEKFTLFDWLKLARKKIVDIHKQNKIPIVVGGTGLYVQALVEGFELEQVKNPRRAEPSGRSQNPIYKRTELEKKSLEQLRGIYCKLQTTDNELDLSNPHRLIRAIEKAQSGIITTKKKPDFEVLQIGIDLPREKLYEKIDKRVDERFEKENMLEEVARLISDDINPQWLKSLGLEYRIISSYVLGNYKFQISNYKSISNDKLNNTKEYREMVQELKYKSHAFARRQLTWYRRFPQIEWVQDKNQAQKLVRNFLKS